MIDYEEILFKFDSDFDIENKELRKKIKNRLAAARSRKKRDLLISNLKKERDEGIIKIKELEEKIVKLEKIIQDNNLAF